MFFGRLPWQGYKFAFQVQQKVKEGQRPSFDDAPPPPTPCPLWVRSLIEKCWQPNAARRPSFVEILTLLEGGEKSFAAANDLGALLDQATEAIPTSVIIDAKLQRLPSPALRPGSRGYPATPLPPLVMPSNMTGFLIKQAGSKRNWKRRWFELYGGMMSYSLNAESRATPIGVFSVKKSAVTSVTILGKQNCMCVMTTSRTWYLCADSAAERDMWVAAIESHAALP